MRNTNSQSGHSVIELLVAIAVFTIGVSSVIVLTLDALTISRRSIERTQAIMLAHEGLEAVRSIRDNDFLSLVNGTYGLTIENGKWIFKNSSDTTDVFTRSIDIRQPGISTNVKEITSTISWYITPTQSKSIQFVQYFTNWKHLPLTEIECFHVDLSGASIEQGSVNKIVRYIWISNPSCNHEINLYKVVITWDKPSTKLTKVRIDNNFLWQGAATSGTILDLIPNEQLGSGENTKEIDQLHWDKSILGTDIGVTFIMADGSFQSFTIPAFN